MITRRLRSLQPIPQQGHINHPRPLRPAHGAKCGCLTSAMATAGTVLGWVGLIGPIVTVALLFFTAIPFAVCVPIVALILAISVLVIYYLRRNNRR